MSPALNRRFFVAEDISSQNQVNDSWSTPPEAVAECCVIQCPSCQTRFSLPISALDGQSDPRFHCSQCDTIFRVENESERPQPSPAPVEVAPEPTTQVFPEIIDSTPTEPIIDTYVNNAFDESFEPQVVANEPQATPQIPSKIFEIPRIVEAGWTIGAPHESAPPEEIASSNATKKADATPKCDPPKRDLLEPTQMSLGLESSPQISVSPVSAPHEVNPAPLEVSKSSTMSNFPGFGIKKKRSAQPAPRKGEVSIQKRQLILESVKRMKIPLPVGHFPAALIIAIPLVVFCSLLLALGHFLRLDPLQSEESMTTMIPGLPRMPPPGLAVIDAHLRKLTLDSGDTIFALSGHVRNNSGKQLRQVHLDGLVFDGNGKVMTEKKAIVSSPLSQSKIKSLSLEMIEDIEANASKGKTTVKDGETAPFVVTFTPPEVSGAKYFTTRIHSVK